MICTMLGVRGALAPEVRSPPQNLIVLKTQNSLLPGERAKSAHIIQGYKFGLRCGFLL